MAIEILAIRQYVLGKTRLCDHGAGGGALVFPVGLENTDGLVVSAETVDSGFDQNEAELGVLVFAVSLEMLADGDSLWGFQNSHVSPNPTLENLSENRSLHIPS